MVDNKLDVEVDRHFVKENLEKKIVSISFVISGKLLTHAVSSKVFQDLIIKLGMYDIYAPTWGGVLI